MSFLRMCLIALICATLAYTRSAQAGGTPDLALHTGTCQEALGACLTVIKAQDLSIANLKRDNTALAGALADASRPPTLPTWAVIGISVLAGAVAGKMLLK